MRSLIAGNGDDIIGVYGYIGFTSPNNDYHPFTGSLNFTAGTDGYSEVYLRISNVFAGDTSFVTKSVHNFLFSIISTEVNAMYS